MRPHFTPTRAVISATTLLLGLLPSVAEAMAVPQPVKPVEPVVEYTHTEPTVVVLGGILVALAVMLIAYLVIANPQSWLARWLLGFDALALVVIGAWVTYPNHRFSIEPIAVVLLWISGVIALLAVAYRLSPNAHVWRALLTLWVVIGLSVGTWLLFQISVQVAI